MPFVSVKDVFANGGLATPDQFEEWSRAWRVAVENGSQERILAFFSRERGLSEEVYLRQLAHAFGWPYVDLPKLPVASEARQRIDRKSTRLNSSHRTISYAVFCLKKKRQ